MMYLWEPAMIRFMEDASEQTTYNDEIADVLRKQLKDTDRVCDVGSGLGYLSDALAPYVAHVTAIDRNGNAVEATKRRLERKNLTNVEAVTADAFIYKPERPFDAMVFCFFGQLDSVLRIAREQCDPAAGRIFVVTRNYSVHRFSVGRKPCGKGGADDMAETLEEQRIPFVRTDLSLEFGQPLRSLEDAMLFFKTYSRDDDPALITEEFVRSKVEKRDRPGFPYYLPHRREISILFLQAADLHR